MNDKKKGVHVPELICAQATIPKDVYEIVRRKAEADGFNMSTYFRKWILDGVKKEGWR